MKNSFFTLAFIAILCPVFMGYNTAEKKLPSGKVKGPLIGEEAPDFELKTSDGKPVKLSDFSDQIVLLNFTNGNNNNEILNLDKVYKYLLQNNYKDAGKFVILNVIISKEEKFQKTITRINNYKLRNSINEKIKNSITNEELKNHFDHLHYFVNEPLSRAKSNVAKAYNIEGGFGYEGQYRYLIVEGIVKLRPGHCTAVGSLTNNNCFYAKNDNKNKRDEFQKKWTYGTKPFSSSYSEEDFAKFIIEILQD
jgi:hypothetical protein